MPAINVMAGSRYPYKRFLFFDLTGQFFWALLYGGLGYLFASQWEQVSQALGMFTLLSVGVTILAVGIYITGAEAAQEVKQ